MADSEGVIGLVAGVGPFAGLDLVSKILAQTTVTKDQDHLTILSLSQPNTIPDRTAYLLGEVPINPANPILAQLQTLENMGATIAGIPCNSAHAPPIFNVIREGLKTAGSQLHLLHMIDEVAAFLQAQYPSVDRIGVLSTTGTYRFRIYPQNLEPAGFTVLLPPAEMQEKVIHPAIYDPVYGIKATGTATNQARANLKQGIDCLRQAGAEAIILGCTEIPLAITEKELDGALMIDATWVLARALIQVANPKKLKSC